MGSALQTPNRAPTRGLPHLASPPPIRAEATPLLRPRSGPSVLVRQARAPDVEELAPKLREADRAEIHALLGLSAQAALTRHLSRARRAYTAVSDDGPFLMFGVESSSVLGVGHVWLVGSSRIEQMSMRFLRQSRFWMAELAKDYAVLTNYVDERNTVHVRWLEWLGCHFTARYPRHGHARIPFLQFVRLPSTRLAPAPPTFSLPKSSRGTPEGPRVL